MRAHPCIYARTCTRAITVSTSTAASSDICIHRTQASTSAGTEEKKKRLGRRQRQRRRRRRRRKRNEVDSRGEARTFRYNGIDVSLCYFSILIPRCAPGTLFLSFSSSHFLKCFLGFTDTFQSTLRPSRSELLPRIHKIRTWSSPSLFFLLSSLFFEFPRVPRSTLGSPRQSSLSLFPSACLPFPSLPAASVFFPV